MTESSLHFISRFDIEQALRRQRCADIDEDCGSKVHLRGLEPSEDKELYDKAHSKAESEVGDPARRQQQQLPTDVQNPGHTAGSLQRVLGRAGFAQRESHSVLGLPENVAQLIGTSDVRIVSVLTTGRRKGPVRPRRARTPSSSSFPRTCRSPGKTPAPRSDCLRGSRSR